MKFKVKVGDIIFKQSPYNDKHWWLSLILETNCKASEWRDYKQIYLDCDRKKYVGTINWQNRYALDKQRVIKI